MASPEAASAGGSAVPAGKLLIGETFLEMLGGPPPALPLRSQAAYGSKAVMKPRVATRIDRVGTPTVAFYRFLYETVGAPWLWHVRRRWSDAQLADTVQHPEVEIHVLYCDGQPAGFAELDRRMAGQVELAYFGLLPQFIGVGLGPYLLDHAVHRAWAGGPQRLWVHTCTLDHPAALRTYEAAGFRRYDFKWYLIDDPRTLGLGLPAATAAPAAGKPKG